MKTKIKPSKIDRTPETIEALKRFKEGDRVFNTLTKQHGYFQAPNYANAMPDCWVRYEVVRDDELFIHEVGIPADPLLLSLCNCERQDDLLQDTAFVEQAGIQKAVPEPDTRLFGQSNVIKMLPVSTEGDSPKPNLSKPTLQPSATSLLPGFQESTSLSSEVLVRTFPLLATEPELLAITQACFLKDSDYCDYSSLKHLSLKMCRESSAATTETISPLSSMPSLNWGMWGLGKSATDSITFPKTAPESSFWVLAGNVQCKKIDSERLTLAECLDTPGVILDRHISGDRIYEAICPTIRSPKGGGSTLKVILSDGTRRNVNGDELERLMGWEVNRKTVILEVWTKPYLEHPNSCVTAVRQCPKLLNSAGNAEKTEKNEPVLFAATSSRSKNRTETKPVEVLVDFNLEGRGIVLHTTRTSPLSVPTAELQRVLDPQKLDAFVLANVLIYLIQGKITLVGKAESPPNVKGLANQSNGRLYVEAYGQSIEESANDVVTCISQAKSFSRFTISPVGASFQNYDLSLQTLCCFVAHVINGFIPEQIALESSYVLKIEYSVGCTKFGTTKEGEIVSISEIQRHKMLGNGIIPAEIEDICTSLRPFLEKAKNHESAIADNSFVEVNSEVVPVSELKEHDQWGTPDSQDQPILTLVKQVLGGEIGLDPTSNHERRTGAIKHFTQADNCLNKDWTSSGVFMNPPFSDPFPFLKKLCEEYENDRFESAIALLRAGCVSNKGTGALIKNYASALCHWRAPRIRFTKSGVQSKNSPDFDCVLVYFGQNLALFYELFSPLGTITRLENFDVSNESAIADNSLTKVNSESAIVDSQIMGESEARFTISEINNACNKIRNLLVDLDERQGYLALGFASMSQLLKSNLFSKAKSTLHLELVAGKIEKENLLVEVGTFPESQLRSLNKLKSDYHGEAIVKAKKIAGDRALTARDVSTTVASMVLERPETRAKSVVDTIKEKTFVPLTEKAQYAVGDVVIVKANGSSTLRPYDGYWGIVERISDYFYHLCISLKEEKISFDSKDVTLLLGCKGDEVERVELNEADKLVFKSISDRIAVLQRCNLDDADDQLLDLLQRRTVWTPRQLLLLKRMEEDYADARAC